MPAASCENHPGREALGVCVACRSRICSECVTKVEGINYCVACLRKLAAAGGRTVGVQPRVSAPLANAALLGQCALLAVGVYVLLQAFLPG